METGLHRVENATPAAATADAPSSRL